MLTGKQIKDAIEVLNELDAADLGDYSYNEVLLAMQTLALLSMAPVAPVAPAGSSRSSGPRSGGPVRSANDE